MLINEFHVLRLDSTFKYFKETSLDFSLTSHNDDFSRGGMDAMGEENERGAVGSTSAHQRSRDRGGGVEGG